MKLTRGTVDGPVAANRLLLIKFILEIKIYKYKFIFLVKKRK